MSATMIIECPNCGTKYNVIEEAIKPRGRTVHCNQCSNKWHVDPVVGTVPGWEERFKPDPIIEPTEERGPAAEDKTPPPVDEKEPKDAKPEEPPQTIDRLSRLAALADSDVIAAAPVIASDVDDGHGSKTASFGLLAASLVLLLGGVVTLHGQIERAFPASARLYQATGLTKPPAGQGLELQDVHASLETESMGQSLTIEAKVVNTQKVPVAVPILHATLISDAKGPLRHWTLDPGTTHLDPGATVSVKASFDGANTENGKILLTFYADNNPQSK